MSSYVKPIPDGYHTVTPYLVCKNAAEAIEFYKNAFGAIETMRMDDPSGHIGHAEVRIGDSPVMLADEFPDMNVLSPESIGGSPVSIMLYVEDVDKSFEKAVEAGATVTRPLENKFYGDRGGSLEDPFGHTWHLSSRIEELSIEELKKRAAAESK
ncbi:MAG: VOC family protein [Deltaproteobacteria bacterium]|jgi:PhnB protein|nr:VOC family protein [Deltaproteobacteria bacterium]MBT4087090.1 VOC family protein [Deltaproteobacteria bacterium]MBT4262683.1 VOC family protein [Deltaproteobacteria bacterium]MBT4643228.1 VOC family protein [Deltaproteobacteria bacterium]MBT6503767.1 VOC family protein [Deltaproteobacteria bacterium]